MIDIDVFMVLLLGFSAGGRKQAKICAASAIALEFAASGFATVYNRRGRSEMAAQDDAQAVVRHVAVVVTVVPMTFVMPVITGVRCAMPVVVPMVPMLRPVPTMVAAPGVMATVFAALFPLLTVVITTCLVPFPGMDAVLTPVPVVVMTLLAVLGTRSVVAAGFAGAGERNRIIAGEEKSDQ